MFILQCLMSISTVLLLLLLFACLSPTFRVMSIYLHIIINALTLEILTYMHCMNIKAICMHDPFWSELKGVRGKWERVVVVHLASFVAMHILSEDLARRLLLMSPVQNENLQSRAVALLSYIVSWWHGKELRSEWVKGFKLGLSFCKIIPGWKCSNVL